MQIEFKVENNFSNRFYRQLVIESGNAVILSEKFDARSDYARDLALQMLAVSSQILVHHEIKEEKTEA